MAEMFTFACTHCGAAFAYPKTRYNKYRKKWGRDPLYCTHKCFAAERRVQTAATAVFVCEGCGKTVQMRRQEYQSSATGRTVAYFVRKQRFCSRSCSNQTAQRTLEGRFQRGEHPRLIDQNGYVQVVPPNNGGKRAYEHRVVMEGVLGRPLARTEQVHHRNGDRADNRPENLELWSRAQPAGQRVIDKIAFAVEMCQLYPEFLAEAGFQLVPNDPPE